MNKKEVLNIDVLKGYAATPEDVRFFADIFIRQTTADLSRLRESCAAGRDEGWRNICHKIRGAAAMAGASRLHDLCEEGEAMSAAEPREKQAFFEKIAAAFDDVCRAFDNEAAPKGRTGS